MKKEGKLMAMWRSYPFVDSFSSAPSGMQHSGYRWDEGDVCMWMINKDREMEDKETAFRGKIGADVEPLPKDSRWRNVKGGGRNVGR